MTSRKTIGFVFIEGFADWEFGFLSGSTAEWFDDDCIALTPEGGQVTSMGGFKLTGDRGLAAADNGDLDAIAVIGSDHWAAENHPDIAPLLNAVGERGGVIGGICAGTLALVRAGLFKNRAHTSNGRDWILHHLPDYPGADHYRDVPHAVVEDRVISAPGSAPGTFAIAFLEALHPDRTKQLSEMRAMFAAEYNLGS